MYKFTTSSLQVHTVYVFQGVSHIHNTESTFITQVQYLKFGLVPRCIGVGWSGNMAKLNLISGLHGTDIQGELHFQKLV